MDFEVEGLLSDSEDEQKKPPKKIVKEPKKTILSPSYGPINLDDSKDSGQKINIAPKIQMNKNINKKEEEPQTNNNNILDFVLGINSNVNNNKSNENNQPINLNQQPIPSIKSNPSSFSNKTSEKISQVKPIIQNKIQSPSIIYPNLPPPANIIFDERKEYEDKIKEYKNQKEQIKSVYSYDIERKIQELKEIEKKLKRKIKENLKN